MNREKKTLGWRTLPLLFLIGCAGLDRSCSSCNAESFGAVGADWIVVQYRVDGSPMACWKLTNSSIANEAHSDGIYWTTSGGHLVHISGWYNRVQVRGARWDEAAKEVDIDMTRCVGGKYVARP